MDRLLEYQNVAVRRVELSFHCYRTAENHSSYEALTGPWQDVPYHCGLQRTLWIQWISILEPFWGASYLGSWIIFNPRIVLIPRIREDFPLTVPKTGIGTELPMRPVCPLLPKFLIPNPRIAFIGFPLLIDHLRISSVGQVLSFYISGHCSDYLLLYFRPRHTCYIM